MFKNEHEWTKRLRSGRINATKTRVSRPAGDNVLKISGVNINSSQDNGSNRVTDFYDTRLPGMSPN